MTTKYIEAPTDDDRIPANTLYDNSTEVIINKEHDEKRLLSLCSLICLLIFVTLSVNTIILLTSENHK
ncbi:hypothetical protein YASMINEVIRUS_104 [Yasminevirus sp. GU-2018]|uniref:Uncharacterized protein n=1 Tax=Yasminevirus sp. GU-2018 TaxID=2420051 RepID=A0A5K0U816_9VIRU|nr:hypothetical protein YASMINEVIRUS_104 [Yasminevirus sp. GU-2018]